MILGKDIKQRTGKSTFSQGIRALSSGDRSGESWEHHIVPTSSNIYILKIKKMKKTVLVIKNQIYIMIIKNGHCLKIYQFSVAYLLFRHNLMLCRNPSFIVWNQCVFAQYNAFVTCSALNIIVKEMKALWCIMHLGRGTKCLCRDLRCNGL